MNKTQKLMFPPKRVKTPSINKGMVWVKPDTEYDVIGYTFFDKEYRFLILDDLGDIITTVEKGAFVLNGDDWIILERFTLAQMQAKELGLF